MINQNKVRLAEPSTKDAKTIRDLLLSVALTDENKPWPETGFLRNRRVKGEAAIKTEIETGELTVPIIEDETGAAAGCVFLSLFDWDGDEGILISRLAILPHFQHRGFARRLYEEIDRLKHTIEPANPALFAYIEKAPVPNKRSEEFHRLQGFNLIGVKLWTEDKSAAEETHGVWKKSA